MELGDKKLRVKKASIGIKQIPSIEMGINAMSMLAGTTSTESEESTVIQLLNLVTPDELMDNEEYEGMASPAHPSSMIKPGQANVEAEICDDVREECEKFGTIVEIKVPRPIGGSRQTPGIGKVYVRYTTTEASTKALRALAGRKFADRTVVTTYFPEVSRYPCPLATKVPESWTNTLAGEL